MMFHNEFGPWLILGHGLAQAQGPGRTKFIMEHFVHCIMFHNESGPWLILGMARRANCYTDSKLLHRHTATTQTLNHSTDTLLPL